MDKFTGLFIKRNGEFELYGKLDSDVESKKELLRKMTDNGGKIGRGKGQIQAEAAVVLHSTKGTILSRKF